MAKGGQKRWSKRVTETSSALDLEEGVFSKDDPRSIARSLKRLFYQSRRLKSTATRFSPSWVSAKNRRCIAAWPPC